MFFTPRLLLPAILLSAHGATGQWTPAANAVKLPDSLVFVSPTAVLNASLVWHPVYQRYYSVRPGNLAFPLETWLPSGGLSVSWTTAGVDTRGLWYNPGTAQVERNCFNALGWATLTIDASFNATNGFTTLFAGMLQPNVQSVGAYDPTTNSVLFYNAGNLFAYARATGTLTTTIPLTGAVLTNVAAYCIFYTGQVGYEVALYDCVAKQVLFFNKNTGALTGQSQLPASAVATTTTSLRFAYTNNRFWLFNNSLRKWNAYCIWNQGCPITVLPVELTAFHGECNGSTPALRWSTASERNSSHFAVQRSTGEHDWEDVGEVPAAGDSQALIHYYWDDLQPRNAPTVFYRLRQVDLDGTSEVFDALALQCNNAPAELLAYPNPATDRVWLQLPTGTEEHSIDVLDMRGCIQYTRRSSASDAIDPIDLSGLGRGAYVLLVRSAQGAVLGRAVVTKQ